MKADYTNFNGPSVLWKNTYCSDRDVQTAEAAERMEVLGLNPSVIDSFLNEETILVTDESGCTRELPEEMRKIVREFEEERACTVYYGMYNEFRAGRCWSFLYVSDSVGHWSRERPGDSTVLPAWIYNQDNPDLSREKDIQIRWNEDETVSRLR